MRQASAGLFAPALLGFSLGVAAPAPAQTVERHLHLSVVDGDGVPVEGLGDRDILVWEDGSSRELLSVGPAPGPMQIDLLVDTSAAARPIIGDLRRSLGAFLDEVDDRHEVAVVTFGGARHQLVEPTTDRPRLRAGLSNLFARPDTATYLIGALDDSADRFRRRQTLRPVVVVVTTTGVDFSDQAPEAVVTRLREATATMHAVVMRTSSVRMTFTGRFGLSQFPSWANRARDTMLDIGPKQTGGRRVDLSTVNGLTEVLSRLAAEISNQYLVVYASPPSLVPPRTVEVRVNSDQQVTVRAGPARPTAGRR